MDDTAPLEARRIEREAQEAHRRGDLEAAAAGFDRAARMCDDIAARLYGAGILETSRVFAREARRLQERAEEARRLCTGLSALRATIAGWAGA